MKTRIIFAVLFLSLLYIACDKNENVLLSDNVKYTNSKITYSTYVEGNTESDPYFLNNSQRNESILYVDVSYSGGCENHEFEVVWDGLIYETNPPQANILISHNANGDACEAFLSDTLTIDLNQVFGESYSDDLKLIIINGSEK